MVYQVLIVEDDPMVLEINQRYLARVPGFVVAGTAATAESALAQTKTTVFDLILVDIHLKAGNGLDFIQTLRAQNYPAELLMITAAGEAEAVRMSFQNGVMDYILKPFQFARLKESLDLFLKRQELFQLEGATTQAQLDELSKLPSAVAVVEEASDELEKGLTQKTLALIVDLIEQQPGQFTVGDITSQINLSHVSVRKYLRYLENQGKIKMELEYGSVGRPTSFYSVL